MGQTTPARQQWLILMGRTDSGWGEDGTRDKGQGRRVVEGSGRDGVVGQSVARLGGSMRVASSDRKSGYRQRVVFGHGVARGRRVLQGRRFSTCAEGDWEKIG